MKWDYTLAFCWMEEKCKLCRDERNKEKAHWVLNIYDDKHHWLQDGLKAMGEKGWELVAVQQTWQPSGNTSSSQYLQYWYIFKKPISN